MRKFNKVDKKVKIAVTTTLMAGFVVANGTTLTYADSENLSKSEIKQVFSSEEKVAGEISMKYENPLKENGGGYISTGKGDAGGKSYGVSQFTSKQGGATANVFVNWLKKEYPEFKQFFDGVGVAGTSSFDEAWKKAYEYSPVKFTNAQKMYTVNQYPVPFVEQAQKEFGIDFSSSLAYQELAYSTSVQFGVRGAIRLCTNAKINSSMTEEEVIKAIYEEKRNSIGKYEFEDCSVAVQEGVRKRFIDEEKDILAILNSDNNKSVPFDEFLSTLNPSYLVMVDSTDYYEDVISLDSEDIIEVLGEDSDNVVDVDLNGAISDEKIEEPQKNIIANIIEELTPIKKDNVNSDKKVKQNKDNKKEDIKTQNEDNKTISNKDSFEDVNQNIEYVSSIDTTNDAKDDEGIFSGLLNFIIPDKDDELVIDSDFNGAFEGYDFTKNDDTKEDVVVSKDAENYIAQEISTIAKSYLNQGTVYKMGGKNKVTLDCSGYVSLVFQDMGLEIDELMTGASKFRSDSKEINREDLRIGDLVFWHDLTGKRHSKVYHIGIYIGDNTVIDCSSDYNGVGTRELSSLQDNNKTYYTFGRYEQLEQKANETLQNQNLQNIDSENSDNLEIATTEDDVVDFDKLKELEKSLENNMFKKLFSKLSLIANGEYDDTNIFIKDRA